MAVLYGARKMVNEEPARVIGAAEDGGFIITGAGDSRLRTAIRELPGATPLADGNWLLPSTPEAAKALLTFAKQHDFDFESDKVHIGSV